MRKRMFVGVALCCAGMFWGQTAVASATEEREQACEILTQYKVYTRAAGWATTSAESYWVTGPGAITYTESEEASHAVGVNASVSMSASAIIAKAEVTFGIDYTYTSSKTTSWAYNLNVASGVTSRGIILHRADRSGVDKLTFSPTSCTLVRTDKGSAWYPINSTANSTYCVARDDYPAFTGWKSSCAAT